jgi:hypothetical protein
MRGMTDSAGTSLEELAQKSSLPHFSQKKQVDDDPESYLASIIFLLHTLVAR